MSDVSANVLARSREGGEGVGDIDINFSRIGLAGDAIYRLEAGFPCHNLVELFRLCGITAEDG